MRVGIPKGLLYYKYHPFLENFFTELGADIITSPDTNKSILDDGVKYCVDEACLPVKVFHGHVAAIRDKCDVMVVPRIMQLRRKEFICPKFCGLPEMIINSIDGLPETITSPIYAVTRKQLYRWASEAADKVTRDKGRVSEAFRKALDIQKSYKIGVRDEGYAINVAMAGHPYNIYDSFINMNIIKKLNNLGVGVVTEEYIDDAEIENQVKRLFKKPFWTFARNNYGFTTHVADEGKVKGIVYISSFACGIDSVVLELIRDRICDFPILVLKIDEHTGEAGIDTRIEAFVDMLERRC